jgi:hypothetical protein
VKAILLLEDTPNGILVEARWQSNDCQDHINDSVAMNVLGNLTMLIKTMQDAGAVRIIDPEKTNP